MKPKKWIAIVLAIFSAPLAFLYVGSLRWAALSFVVTAAIAIAGFLAPGHDSGIAAGLASLALMLLWIWRAYRFAADATERTVRPWYVRWHGLLALVGVFTLTILVLRVFLYEPFRIPSSAMLPTLPLGSNVVVQKWGYGHYSTMGFQLGGSTITVPVLRGDIIVFDYPVDPKQSYIKRVIGVPGDRIVYRDKRVLVNGVDIRGKELPAYLDAERLVYRKRFSETLDAGTHDILFLDAAPARVPGGGFPLPKECTDDGETLACTVPPASYFVMGDNRDNTLDSRFWGFVPARAVIGKVVYIAMARN
ncbi:signal peptidase I [Duganella sp. sic0402]|uniref:signal peptidase I n=1 Tax=Duganella sp. sic0402 TaxID=2854786 RepID=UPI001C46F4C9|nr:signal peptidase I [Duganella sp. sic0402]MBV7538156.1 signal peptidase I [Duganella sp. sic0402]